MNLLLFRAVLTSLQTKQDIKIIILLLFRAVLTTIKTIELFFLFIFYLFFLAYE